MHTYVIDLGSPFFWVFLAVIALLLAPVVDPRVRGVLLAAADLAFVALLTTAWGAVAAAGYALGLQRLSLIARPDNPRSRTRMIALTTGGAAVLAIFLAHKLAAPWAAADARSPVTRLLSAVGYSYVALRSVELLRAGKDGIIEGSWLDAVRYLFPFHMLAAGPIQSWRDFVEQPRVCVERDTRDVLMAIDRIVHGLFKKFVLARMLQVTLLTGFTAPLAYQLFEVQAYYIWVYLDFSAYSDLAVGAGRLLGVATPENFNKPLRARNIIVFWDRWHMSLSSWVRRNVFIPVQLTLMRRTGGAHALSIASLAFGVSFLLVGLWHEVSLRFFLWGAMHAGALIACNLWQRFLVTRSGRAGLAEYQANPLYRIVATMLTFEFVALSLAFIVHPATAFLDWTS